MKPDQTNRPDKILVLTHNFPRFPGDVSAPGFMPLFRQLQSKLPLEFLIPHDAGLAMSETVDGIQVHRFRYGRDSRETLAYRGDMHRRIWSQPLSALRFYLSFRRKAGQLADSIRPTAIWAHWWLPSGLIGARLSRRTGLPLIVSCHGTDIAILLRSSLARGLARRVFRQASSVIVVSNYLKQQLQSLMGNDVADLERRMVVAPLPINSEAFSFKPDTERQAHRIVAATRYTTQKKHDILIKAVAKLREANIDCTVDLYGSGPERENLQTLIDSLSLTSVVRLNDSIPHAELAEQYLRSEISLLVSEREGFGLTLVEAMLCGCAVIGANSGGITDIITKDGHEGLLVPLGDVDALCDALKKLLNDSQLRQKLANQGREAVEERFAVGVIEERYLQALRVANG